MSGTRAAARLVLASHNPAKARELAALLELPGVAVLGLDAFPGAPVPEEDGATLLDNARIKARAALRHTGLPAIADDTGLEVDALGGAPGVRSARFAGPAARDPDNVALLLARMAGVADPRRTARFRTVCVACFPTGEEVVSEGTLEGRIAERPRGGSGFGYDPVFEVEGRTLAERTADEKHAISHRGRAVRGMRAELSRMLAMA